MSKSKNNIKVNKSLLGNPNPKQRAKYDKTFGDTIIKYINSILNISDQKCYISAQKIADATGIPRRSITRYMDGETKPNEERQELIVNFLSKVYQEQTDLYFERMRVNDEEIEAVDYEITDEDDSYYMNEVSETLPTARTLAGFNADGLGKYTLKAQQFIVDNFEMIWCIENYEITLINMLRSMTPANRDKVISMLENIPVSFDLISYSGYDTSTSLTVPRLKRISVGSHKIEYVIQKKLNIYEQFIRKQKFAPFSFLGDKDNPVINDNLRSTFNDLCIECANKHFGEEYDDEYELVEEPVPDNPDQLVTYRRKVERDFDFFGARIYKFHKRYYENLDKILTFTNKEWYCLYLFCRLQITDMLDTADMTIHKVNDNYFVKKNEFLFWEYLSMLSK